MFLSICGSATRRTLVFSIPIPANDRTMETFIFFGNCLIASTALPSNTIFASSMSSSISELAGFRVVNETLVTRFRGCASVCNRFLELTKGGANVVLCYLDLNKIFLQHPSIICKCPKYAPSDLSPFLQSIFCLCFPLRPPVCGTATTNDKFYGPLSLSLPLSLPPSLSPSLSLSLSVCVLCMCRFNIYIYICVCVCVWCVCVCVCVCVCMDGCVCV